MRSVKQLIENLLYESQPHYRFYLGRNSKAGRGGERLIVGKKKGKVSGVPSWEAVGMGKLQVEEKPGVLCDPLATSGFLWLVLS